MMISTDDVLLGQLALARGLLQFKDLLECIYAVGREGRALQDLLIARGLLTHQQVESLTLDLQNEEEDVLGEIEVGQTLILDHIEMTTNESVIPSSEPPLSLRQTVPPKPSSSSSRGEDDGGAPFDAQLPALPAEQRRRYELRDVLGKGGMGEVWRAFDRVLNREVALKTLRTDQEHGDKLLDHLRLEATVTGLLEHPSIIPVYDLGELEELGLYYTMRIVREESLEQRLWRARESERDRAHNSGDEVRAEETERAQAQELTRLVGILRTVLLALQYAHDHGVIHRDLKPENILVGAYGEVFIIDWGVAKIHNEQLDESLHRVSLGSARHGALVGTPSYMAPEQALGEHERVDERTDVYAMGVILYEFLTRKPVFEADHVLALLFKVTEQAPEPPSQRAPTRHIPEELEEICLRALRKAPEDRYQSAQEMAHELKLFLEGVKERERLEAKASEIMDEADEYRRNYQGALGAYAGARAELTRRQASIPNWAPIEQKEPMWQIERRAEELRMELERHFGEAARAYGQVLGYLPDHRQARRQLAELYWQRFLRAEASGDEANAIYFEGLVRQYNDGQYDTLLAGLATLTVRAQPRSSAPVKLKLYRYERGMHRLQPRFVTELECPLLEHQIPNGSYLLTAEAPDHIGLRVPLLLERQREQRLELALPARGDLPEDLIIVSGGSFLSGNVQAYDRDRCREHVDTFAIMRYPVTCQQWADYMNALVEDGRLEEARARAPRIKEDADTYFTWDAKARRFGVPEEDSDGDAWHPNWPICMITHEDAQAYARWRSEREGLLFRLPTSLEWEKAARGVDGRLFTWGNKFDAAFCRNRESERGRPFPAPVGSYPLDCSPYGIYDMTGNIREWTSTWASEAEGTLVLQGASFSSIAAGCRLDWSTSSPPHFRYASYGFRLVAEVASLLAP